MRIARWAGVGVGSGLVLVVGAAAGAFFYHSWYVGHSHSLIVILNHTVRITMMTLYFLFSDNDNMS